MSRTKCTDCHLPIPNGQAFVRTNSRFERVSFCKPCAEDAGWIVPAPRGPLSVELEKVAGQMVAEVEAYVGAQAS